MAQLAQALKMKSEMVEKLELNCLGANYGDIILKLNCLTTMNKLGSLIWTYKLRIRLSYLGGLV